MLVQLMNMQLIEIATKPRVCLIAVLSSSYSTNLNCLMKFPPVGDVNFFIGKALWLREPNVSTHRSEYPQYPHCEYPQCPHCEYPQCPPLCEYPSLCVYPQYSPLSTHCF